MRSILDRDGRSARVGTAATVLAFALLGATPVLGQNNTCEAGEFPDVIVGSLPSVQTYGSVGNITAFSVATTSCNQGTCWLDWFESTPQHPVIAQNLYRLRNGRFEQIGQSWLKHGFLALSQTLCSNDCISTSGTHLGVNCSDPYSAGLNGSQSGLGPRFEVNAATGVFAYPFSGEGQTGDAIYKRLQVHNDDLNPALNTGALYFVEGHYVTADDAAAGNQDNNASYRRALVSGTTSFSLSLTGSTVRRQPAILAWQANDPGVDVVNVDVPADGRFIAAMKATPLGGGSWRYEYAVHNLNSDRSARTFRVPIPPGALISNVGFHDVDYHSGEPYVGSDWSAGVGPDDVVWTTQTFAQNPNANALRWGTLYNFRFDANRSPGPAVLSIDLFKPGSPASISWTMNAPGLCDADGQCDPDEDSCLCPEDCGIPPLTELDCTDGVDDDCDGISDCADLDCCASLPCDDGVDNDGDGLAGCDCNDNAPAFWATPGEVEALSMSHSIATGVSELSWSPPLAPGGFTLEYEVLDSSDPTNFSGLGVGCTQTMNALTMQESSTLVPGSFLAFLIRASNRCPQAKGPLGLNSFGVPRTSNACP